MINRGLKAFSCTIARNQQLKNVNKYGQLSLPQSQTVFVNSRMFCNKETSALDEDGSDKDFASVNKVQTKDMDDKEILKQIDDIVQNNKIVLFMKGSPEMPNCGYSRFVSQVLRFYSIKNII